MKFRFLYAMVSVGVAFCSQAMGVTISTEGTTDTIRGEDSIVVQKDHTINKIENSANGTFINVQANLIVNSDLSVKQISLSQYDKVCSLTVNGDLTLTPNSKKEGGTLSIAQGESVTVTGTTTLNGSGSQITNPATLTTGKLVVNNQTSTSGTIKSNVVDINHTFSLLGGTISSVDGTTGSFNVNEGGHVWQQGCTVDLDTVVKGGQMTVYSGSFANLTMEDGTLNVRGSFSTGNITLAGGSVIFNEGTGIDLGGNILSVGESVVIKLLVASVDELSDSYNLFKNVGELADNLNNLTVVVSDYEGKNETTMKLTYSNGGVNATIPEPTTATLSLLALAAMAARRRRK